MENTPFLPCQWYLRWTRAHISMLTMIRPVFFSPSDLLFVHAKKGNVSDKNLQLTYVINLLIWTSFIQTEKEKIYCQKTSLNKKNSGAHFCCVSFFVRKERSRRHPNFACVCSMLSLMMMIIIMVNVGFFVISLFRVYLAACLVLLLIE